MKPADAQDVSNRFTMCLDMSIRYCPGTSAISLSHKKIRRSKLAKNFKDSECLYIETVVYKYMGTPEMRYKLMSFRSDQRLACNPTRHVNGYLQLPELHKHACLSR